MFQIVKFYSVQRMGVVSVASVDMPQAFSMILKAFFTYLYLFLVIKILLGG